VRLVDDDVPFVHVEPTRLAQFDPPGAAVDQQLARAQVDPFELQDDVDVRHEQLQCRGGQDHLLIETV